ncbi:hypothetical protein BJ165DRAFT_1399450 [Panaeolus papilionaceus]|nr:hypothetical protein BJ165DRAFT_1399450 [Panaeolus papilionaceus]
MSTLPALRLAPELWCRIFFQIVIDSWHSQEPAYREPPWVDGVTHVCQYWRNIALNDHHLWCRIGSFSSKWADVQIERSINAPVHFRITSTTVTSQRTISQHIHEALDLVSHRLHSLTFTSAPPYLPHFQEEAGRVLQKLYTGKFPVLHRLSMDIVCHSIQEPVLAPEFIRENFPNLQHLSLRGFKLLWTLTLFSNLTSLRLETDSENHSMGTLSEFLAALERMPLLEKLYMQWVSSDESHVEDPELVEESRIVAMTHLRNLTLRISLLDDCVDILWHIAYPASTRIRLHLDAEGSDAVNESTGWYNADEIGDVVVPDLSDCLESRLTPILVQHTLYSRHAYPSDKQIPPPAAYITIAVRFDQDPDVEVAKRHLLSLLPLSNLQSIALDQESTTDFFRTISNFPALRVISMQGRSAVQFFDYLNTLYGDIEGGNYIGRDSDGQPSSLQFQEVPGIASDGRVMSMTHFHSLDSLAFEHVDFGIYEDTSINEDTVNLCEILAFLSLRRDVLGLPIKRIRFRDCINFFAEDVEEIKKFVEDVEWDGKIHERDDSECDSEPTGDWETDDEWVWNGSDDGGR